VRRIFVLQHIPFSTLQSHAFPQITGYHSSIASKRASVASLKPPELSLPYDDHLDDDEGINTAESDVPQLSHSKVGFTLLSRMMAADRTLSDEAYQNGR
jgi:hypothetical protein